MSRPWPTADMIDLRLSYPDTDNAELAQRYGRTPLAVKRMAETNDIFKSAEFCGTWSDEDLLLLSRLFPDTKNADIAKRLDRSEDGICAMATKLELKKDPAYLLTCRKGVRGRPSKRMAFIAACADLLAQPTGAKLSELAARTITHEANAKAFCYKAVRDGQLFSCGGHAHMRYFLTAEGAQAGASLIAEVMRQRKDTAAEAYRARARDARRLERASRPPKAPKPIKIKAAKPLKIRPFKALKLPKALPAKSVNARALAAEGFKRQTACNVHEIQVQRLPGYERVCEPPKQRVVGGFLTAGIGHYPLPASAWAAR